MTKKKPLNCSIYVFRCISPHHKIQQWEDWHLFIRKRCICAWYLCCIFLSKKKVFWYIMPSFGTFSKSYIQIKYSVECNSWRWHDTLKHIYRGDTSPRTSLIILSYITQDLRQRPINWIIFTTAIQFSRLSDGYSAESKPSVLVKMDLLSETNWVIT